MPVARQQLIAQGVDPVRLVFIDDASTEESINNHRVLTYDSFLNEAASGHFVAIAVADSKVRELLAEKCSADQVSPWTVRADNVVVMDDVEIGDGALLSPFVTITSNIQIGRYFHGNLYSYVEHDCRIGDFVTFAPGVKCNGNVVDRRSRLYRCRCDTTSGKARYTTAHWARRCRRYGCGCNPGCVSWCDGRR